MNLTRKATTISILAISAILTGYSGAKASTTLYFGAGDYFNGNNASLGGDFVSLGGNSYNPVTLVTGVPQTVTLGNFGFGSNGSPGTYGPFSATEDLTVSPDGNYNFDASNHLILTDGTTQTLSQAYVVNNPAADGNSYTLTLQPGTPLIYNLSSGQSVTVTPLGVVVNVARNTNYQGNHQASVVISDVSPAPEPSQLAALAIFGLSVCGLALRAHSRTSRLAGNTSQC